MVNKIFELQKQKIFLKFKFNEYFLRYIFEQGNETKTQIKKTQIKKTQIKNTKTKKQKNKKTKTKKIGVCKGVQSLRFSLTKN